MNKICKLLPEEINKNSQENEIDYINRLYNIFLNQFEINKIFFQGIRVVYKKEPKTNGYDKTFYHLITEQKDKYSKSESNRKIDYARSSCILWIKPTIENYNCKDLCCNGIKVWNEKGDIHIFHESVRYLVVISTRKNQNGYKYYLIKTAFYLNKKNKNQISNLMKRYEQYKNIAI